ncbi:hypothetical protein ANO11243_014550 [Dothideomycetidae sp. 11243]|nr:hypothetical protein ANO11243_014550 [fungal sp. No.11243]
MATADDAATVLEQFCHDVANLPAEIAHLLEEIKAKDEQIVQCRDTIVSRDNMLQRHVKTAGSHVKHPKEESFTKVVHDNFERMEGLQKEKLALSQKAMIVLERQIKRFDVKLRDLHATDQFPRDPSTSSTSAAGRKRVRTSMLPSKKGDRRRQLARDRGARGSPSASPTPSDSHASTSPSPSAQQSQEGATGEKKKHASSSVKHKSEAPSDDEDAAAVENGEDDDTEVYCSCQRTSFGDMIGCDNFDCKYQWFHWSCVGLKESPPAGEEWLCPFCRVLPKNQIRKEGPEE